MAAIIIRRRLAHSMWCGDLTRDFASVTIKYRIFVVKTQALEHVIRVKDFIPKQMFELNFDIGI